MATQNNNQVINTAEFVPVIVNHEIVRLIGEVRPGEGHRYYSAVGHGRVGFRIVNPAGSDVLTYTPESLDEDGIAIFAAGATDPKIMLVFH